VSVPTENGDVYVPAEIGDVSVPAEIGDVSVPTENGGFTHTNASRAKISAANKGKIPWNKGKSRSEETRARIAASVRAKYRERFLQEAKDLNLTEEEYEKHKEAKRRKRNKERSARRAEKGPSDKGAHRRGVKLSEETRKKISESMRKRWSEGTYTRKTKEETRRKISETLKSKWQDPEFRDKMMERYQTRSKPSK